MKTTAIIVAAGSGSRFNSDTPKQFFELRGKPIFVHALEQFQSAPSIDTIILVLPADRVEALQLNSIAKCSAVVAGGETRAGSVLNGLNAIDDETEMVAVHDGARPLITVDDIERVVRQAKNSGAACLVGPVTDTIKSIVENEIVATLDREKLRRALTPQVFRIDLLRKAFETAKPDESMTDECYLVEKLGCPITIVEGNSRNIKITQPEDLLLAEALLVESAASGHVRN